jgi:hypothetical protein
MTINACFAGISGGAAQESADGQDFPDRER